MKSLREHILDNLDNKEHAVVLEVAIGHIHDLIYDEYGDELAFASSRNKTIVLSTLCDPDGLNIVVGNDGDSLLYTTMLSNSIYTSLGNIEPNVVNLENIADVLEYVYDLMLEEGMEPEQYYEYG